MAQTPSDGTRENEPPAFVRAACTIAAERMESLKIECFRFADPPLCQQKMLNAFAQKYKGKRLSGFTAPAAH
jgi:hypothetical protein